MHDDTTLFVPPAAGPKLGRGITWKVQAADMHGSVSLFEGTLPPGVLVPPHVHANEDECTHVIEGELVFDIGGRELTATAGAYVLKPRGIPHAFWNPTTRPARVLEIVSPGNLDTYFRELTALQERTDLADGARRSELVSLQARYGIHTDWTANAALLLRLGRC